MDRRKFLSIIGGSAAVASGGYVYFRDKDSEVTDTNNTTDRERINRVDRDIPFDVQIALDNIDQSSWEVVSVSGSESVAEEGTENPTINLQPDVRYRFSNFAGSQTHPIEFISSDGDVLLSETQEYTGDEPSSVEVGDGFLEFTLSGELLFRVDGYRCAFHDSMTGSIKIDSVDEENSQQNQNAS